MADTAGMMVVHMRKVLAIPLSFRGVATQCFSPEIGIGYFISSVSCYEYRFVTSFAFTDLEIIL